MTPPNRLEQDDLVERLKHYEGDYHSPRGLLSEAADEITRLRSLSTPGEGYPARDEADRIMDALVEQGNMLSYWRDSEYLPLMRNLIAERLNLFRAPETARANAVTAERDAALAREATLTARVAELEAGLRPFAALADRLDDRIANATSIWPASNPTQWYGDKPLANAGDFRHARVLLIDPYEDCCHAAVLLELANGPKD